MIQTKGVGALIRVMSAGTVPLQPGGVIRKLPACVPVVRQPGEASTYRALATSNIGHQYSARKRSSAPWSCRATQWNKECQNSLALQFCNPRADMHSHS